MSLDPITISVTALGVSIFSLILSSYRAGVDRKLQWEQMRGSVYTRLTARGVEILTMIEEVRRFPTDESDRLIQKLVRIAQGVVEIRKTLKKMETPPLFRTSTLITKHAPIKSELDDADLIFEELRNAIQASDIHKASGFADGLIQRFYGTSAKDHLGSL